MEEGCHAIIDGIFAHISRPSWIRADKMNMEN